MNSRYLLKTNSVTSFFHCHDTITEYLVDNMCLKRRHNGLLLVALTIALHLKGSASSSSEENLNSQDEVLPPGKQSITQLGNHCLKLPEIDHPSFRTLIEQKCYVDKTEYLNKIALRKTKNYFLSRPRRFGKTLLVDTLEEFFRGEKELFYDTEIYRRRPSPWPKYPMIRIDLSDEISASSEAKFEASLMYKLRNEGMKNNITLDAPTVEGAIGTLITRLSEKFNLSVVVLIDEYDSPYVKSYTRGDMDETSKILGVLQSFFSTLKAKHNITHFCFVTGITRLALSDLFSGFNAAADLTMDEDFAGIVGFNELELHKYFGNQIKNVATAKKVKVETILEEMKFWHDGFQFTSKDETLYSPCSVIGYLRTKAVSTTSWSDTGGPSSFLIQKLKEFPSDAVKFFKNQLINRKAKEMKDRRPSIKASRQELTGKIDFGNSDVRALVALLFHSGYLSIRQYEQQSDVFTLNFTNLELEGDYATRLTTSLTHNFTGDFINKIKLMIDDLDAYEWEDFVKKLKSCYAEIPYQITTNQHEAKEAWFQFSLYLMLSHATTMKREVLVMEDSTNMGRADIAFSSDLAIFIFELKLEDNPENPVYECKEKYLQKHLFSLNRNVFCIGLRFTVQGSIHSWGVASFKCDGELFQEDGSITLTNQLSSTERQEISNTMVAYAKENTNCTLKPEAIIDLLEGVGTTTEGQLVFAEKFSKNIETLCGVLEKIKSLFSKDNNIRGMIFSFLKAAKPHLENLAMEKPADSSASLLYLSEILKPAQDLFANQNFSISFNNFVRFIHRCDGPSKEASSIVSDFTNDIPNLVNLLDKSFPIIKEPFIKSRIDRIRKVLKKTT